MQNNEENIRLSFIDTPQNALKENNKQKDDFRVLIIVPIQNHFSQYLYLALKSPNESNKT